MSKLTIEEIEVTLKNAVKPEYYFHATCCACGEEGAFNSGFGTLLSQRDMGYRGWATVGTTVARMRLIAKVIWWLENDPQNEMHRVSLCDMLPSRRV